MTQLSFLLFFPSVTFGLLSAEIFPWGLIVLFFGPKKYNKNILYLLIYFMLYSLIGYFNTSNLVEVFRSLMAYMNVMIILNYVVVIDDYRVQELVKLARSIFIFLIILGLLQLSGILSPISFIFKILVPRGAGELFGGGRGVTLLSTEPSRAGIEIVYLYSLIRLNIKKRLQSDILILLFNVIAIRSATSLFINLLYLIFEYRNYWLRISIIFFVLIILSVQIQSIGNFRGLKILMELFDELSFQNAYLLLLKESGFRLISLIAAYLFGFRYLLGYGIGAWKISILEGFKLTGIPANQVSFFKRNYNGQYSPVRPVSFYANLLIDIGFLGSLVPLYFIYKSLKVNEYFSKDKIGLILLFIFTTFLYGAAGNPIPWIVVALGLRHKISEIT